MKDLELEKLLAAAHANFVCLDDLRDNRLALKWWQGFTAGVVVTGLWWIIFEAWVRL